ncbi:hypothetical protein SUNI508_10886 [Seiridium unicorne]|uniref:Uncharacterized protein n=1 Tax=Seiridium unicorne TaxID=138068 RepID=A0ABR2UJH6_9PEZI
MLAKHFQSYRPDGLIEKLGLKTLFAFFSTKAMRGGPRLLPQITICVVILITLTKLLPTRFTDVAFGSGYTKILKWRPTVEHDDGSVAGGLRVVVFGGGDIASPNKSPEETGFADKSWTEILCQQLNNCNAHLSYMPRTNMQGGSIISNNLYRDHLDLITSWPNATQGEGFNYTWMLEHHPVPSQPDLEEQINSFLATPAPRHPPRETLWVFNYGYWDVWKLAAMPREIAKEMMEIQAEHLFSQIELLYQKAREESSIAYSDFYTVLVNTSAPASEIDTAVVLDVPAESFRIFIPSLFDISLTPGFATARPKPPHPHSQAKEMGNAAYLTEQWEILMTEWIDAWIAIPDPVANGTANDTALVEKRDASGRVVYVPNARREAITHDAPKYIRELIIDRQLRDSEVTDHNGLGTKPVEEGFLEVWEPCMPLNARSNATSISTRQTKSLAGTQATQATQAASGICSLPNEHLFWTEFTIAQKAIDEIGKAAANRFRMHVSKGVNWLKKWQETELVPREFHG